MPRHAKHQPYSRYQPPARSCGKLRFAHKHEAEQAAEESMIVRPDTVLRVYKCIDCRGWHLTRDHEKTEEIDFI